MHLMEDDLSTTATTQLNVGALVGGIVVYLAVLFLVIGGLWKTFAKAGKPGWYALIPILNILTVLRISGKSGWWFLLFMIPVVNFVFLILTYVALARAFGRGGGFAFGLIALPFVFVPILGFGSSRYQGNGIGGTVAPQQYAAV